MPDLLPNQLMTVKQVQEALNVCRRTVYVLRQRGELPSVVIGRAVRFKPSDVQSYLDRLTAAR